MDDTAARPITFSYRTPASWSWEQVLAVWGLLDKGGDMDELWLVDHLAARRADDRRFDAWMALAALAARTRRVRLGLLVSPIVFRHPALLAYSAATVDRVSGGRLNVGLGAGGGLAGDDAVMGLESWRGAERAARFDDYVAIVDGLLRGQSDIARKHYRTHGAVPIAPAQAPRPRLTVAANGPRALRTAARYADRWVSLGGQTDSPSVPQLSLADAVARTREQNALLERLCRELGREPSAISRAIATFGAHSHPYASDDAFRELILAYRDAGIDHFALPLVAEEDPLYPRFERILTVLIPQLRQEQRSPQPGES